MFFMATEFFMLWMEGATFLKAYFGIISGLGIFLWPFVIGKESVTFYRTDVGMTYQFSQNMGNTLYNIYCVWVGLNFFWIIIRILRKAKRRKLKAIMKLLIWCVLVVMLGMVFDTVLPMFGFDALPGSTISQGIGILMISRVLEFQKTSEITIENLSKFIYYSVDTPVLIYDESGKFCIANEGAGDFFSKNQKELRTGFLWEIFDLSEQDMEFLGNKRIEEVECLLNNRYCQVEIDKIYDEYQEITGYIVVLNDLTEKRDFIQKLQLSEQEADRANHAKSDFLARMSHEIRTPINGIIGMNEMILKKNKDEQIAGYAEMMRLSANNLLGLVNEILDISKIEANHVEIENEEYSLLEVLKEIASIGYIKAGEKGIDFQVDVQEALPRRMYGDGKKLRQIVMNVVGNALKYTKEGYIILRAKGLEKENGYYLHIEVEDSGIGIKPEHIHKIFDVFERVDTKVNQGVEGTGLGLPIVKHLVRLMEGTITVESEYGKGSKFVIEIPQEPRGEMTFTDLQNAQKQEEANETEQMGLRIPNKRLLVVDDNEINQIVASELLAYTQAEIDVAGSGKECLELARQKRYDFILMDHIMPGMDGVETLAELQKMPDNMSKDAVMMVFTANAIEGARQEYLDMGFQDYLSKPIDVAQVERVLAKYC